MVLTRLDEGEAVVIASINIGDTEGTSEGLIEVDGSTDESPTIGEDVASELDGTAVPDGFCTIFHTYPIYRQKV